MYNTATESDMRPEDSEVVFAEEVQAVDEDLKRLDEIENILDLEEGEYPILIHCESLATHH